MRRKRIGAKADLSEEHPRADLRGPCGECVLVTQSRRTACLLFRRKMPFGASRRWSRYRPKADIGASVGSAIYLRDQGNYRHLTDVRG